MIQISKMSARELKLLRMKQLIFAPLDIHAAWLDDIRETVWARINYEDEMIPSLDAHWNRSCWILDMWRQADKNTMNLKVIGWTLKDGVLSVDWDRETNISSIESRVFLLMKGCKCKTGCKTAHCGCRKKGKNCSEGHSCLHCSNLSSPVESETAPDESTPGKSVPAESSRDESSPSENLELEENDLSEYKLRNYWMMFLEMKRSGRDKLGAETDSMYILILLDKIGPLIWIPEMRPTLYSVHFEISQCSTHPLTYTAGYK